MSAPQTPAEMEPPGEEERPPARADEGKEGAALASGPARRGSRVSSLEDADEPEAQAVVVAGGGCQEQELTYELRQGHRILGEFLHEKHRGLTAPFLQPLGGVAGTEEAMAQGRRGGGLSGLTRACVC